jgi:hypothetical protein
MSELVYKDEAASAYDRAVREEVRRSLGDTGGPIAIESELRFASGHR